MALPRLQHDRNFCFCPAVTLSAKAASEIGVRCSKGDQTLDDDLTSNLSSHSSPSLPGALGKMTSASLPPSSDLLPARVTVGAD